MNGRVDRGSRGEPCGGLIRIAGDIALGTVAALDKVYIVSARSVSVQNGIVAFSEGAGTVDRSGTFEGGRNGAAIFKMPATP